MVRVALQDSARHVVALLVLPTVVVPVRLYVGSILEFGLGFRV